MKRCEVDEAGEGGSESSARRRRTAKRTRRTAHAARRTTTITRPATDTSKVEQGMSANCDSGLTHGSEPAGGPLRAGSWLRRPGEEASPPRPKRSTLSQAPPAGAFPSPRTTSHPSRDVPTFQAAVLGPALLVEASEAAESIAGTETRASLCSSVRQEADAREPVGERRPRGRPGRPRGEGPQRAVERGRRKAGPGNKALSQACQEVGPSEDANEVVVVRRKPLESSRFGEGTGRPPPSEGRSSRAPRMRIPGILQPAWRAERGVGSG